MKKLVLIGGLFLAGCSTTPSSTADISAKAKEIQGYTQIACKFIPTVGTIANILSSGASIPLATIANDICAAVTTAPLADGPGRVPKITYANKTTVIKGSFVK